MNGKHIICDLCRVELEPRKTHFTYLGHAFQAEVPACPVCGQVFIDEEMVKGRMARVEMELEDK
jgi:YgiT-type zinc finger domain-containing protein